MSLLDISISYMNHSRTDYVILGLLTVEPNLSGYDIRKAVESSIGYFWSESYGQIYPALKRLAAKGLIQPSASTPKSRRRQYSITPSGRQSLQQWLAQPFYNEPPRNEFLLKLFFGAEAPVSVSAAHIRDLNQKNRQMLATALEIESMAQKHPPQSPHLPYWMLTLTLGIALTRAALEWGESALAQIESPAPTPDLPPPHDPPSRP